MSDFNLEHFGSRLSACRKAMDILQTDFSEQLRCTNGAYSLYERGKRRPPLEMLDILCQDFGLSLDHLVSCMTPYEQVFQERLVSIVNQNPDKPLEGLLDDIGVDQRAALIFTSGTGFPNSKVLKRICLYYDCSLEYLTGLSDNMHAHIQLPVSIPNSFVPRDPFDDLTPEQRSAIELSLKAFRDANAAKEQEA